MDVLLLDFNGVLVDDEPLHLAGFNEVLAELGVRLTDQEYLDRYLGFDDRGAFRAALRDHGRDERAVDIDDLIRRKAAIYLRRARAELRFFSGAETLVRTMAHRVPVGIVSGALRPEIELALELLGVRSLVSSIVAAEDVAECKPNPEGYQLALERFRAAGASARPSHVVAVEDSMAGIESALSAGLRVVGVAHTYPRERLEGAGASVVVDNLHDVTLERLQQLVP